MQAASESAPAKFALSPRSTNGMRSSKPFVAVAAFTTLLLVMPAVFVSSNATSRLLGFVPPPSTPRPELSATLPRYVLVASAGAEGSVTESTYTVAFTVLA